jgi:cytochrome c553
MKLHRWLLSVSCGLFISLGQTSLSLAADPAAKTFDEDQAANKDCVGCHINVTPGIVK